jgi:uncharacterized protein (TIGR02594 family)
MAKKAKQPTKADVQAAMATQTAGVPPWLNTMRAITGLTETPGDADNSKILAMADYIARKYPEMASYCAQYNHDSIAWCGLCAAFCCATADVRPPFGATDTDKFLWAQSFAYDPGFVEIADPILGCIIVMTRSGGGHVTLWEGETNGSNKCRGGNQSDAVNVSNYSKSDVIKYVWPKGAPMPERTVSQGDSGADVAEVQRILQVPADGDFGPTTDAVVKSFQAAAGLTADGQVGPNTWAALDDLDQKQKDGESGLSDTMIADIVELVDESPLLDYSWKDRGKAPPGYLAGMACSFALAVDWYKTGSASAAAMAQADRNNADTDVLTWYRSEMQAKGWDNSQAGLDTLRHLFVLMIGLGVRESSGVYWEGRDTTASNVQADTAEAGLFQTSWNIATADPAIPPMLTGYWGDPNGFWPQFREGTGSPNASDIGSYGMGDGARYQFLAKHSPAFAAMVTAIGLRKRRQHWGPVTRKELELRDEADVLLQDVQALMDSAPEPPEPEPIPPDEQAEVNITLTAAGPVTVKINGQVVT